MSSKTERKDIVRGNGVSANHSHNQYTMKNLRENEERGQDRKKQKANARKRQFLQDWNGKQSELNLTPKERFDLAQNRIANGTETDGDVILVLTHDEDFEAFGYKVDRFKFSPNGTEQEKTIVEPVPAGNKKL